MDTATGRTTRYPRAVLSIVATLTLLTTILAGCGGDSDSSQGATVYIDSQPDQGASININGQPFGDTPATIRSLPAGQFYAVLSLYGFKRKTETILVPEEGEVRIVAKLQPIVGFISIDSDPQGAQVYLDDFRVIGTTPIFNVPITVGAHDYELRKSNYLTLKSRISVDEDYRYRREHILSPMDGHLQIFSRPSNATIYLNDQLQTEKTPARFDLTPGTYTVGVHEKGYIMAEKVIEIAAKGDHSVDLRMKEGSVPPGMVLVPAGEFTMGVADGAPDEMPQRKITLDSFYLDKFEVTNKDFAETFPNHNYETSLAEYPATGITWSQATQYAAAIGKRLPTEEEWEKAARGVDAREYPWGNVFGDSNANIKQGRRPAIKKIGQYRAGASPYGAMDMSGNVYEWTSSLYQPYEGNTEITVEYGQVYRVLRGGSYLSDVYEVRCARRHFDKVDSNREDYGFRCAMDIPEATKKP